ncbi:ABC transporter substrate-binding protein [Immundisolibacter sp.]|uniref:ABC transporter substrate-binding protein n=2 Tax=Immundisolibacter sp. TaxID=1934948 RepID=UPI0035642564
MTRPSLSPFTWGHANQGGQHDWPFLMALEQGFFADEGIDLSIRVVAGGDALAKAMGRGEIDLGRMGTPPFLQAVGNGSFPDGRIVASSVIGNLDHFLLVVRPEITDLAQLRGCTVGVLSRGSCDGHLMRMLLTRAGLDPDRDVRYHELWSRYETVDGMASGGLSAQLMVEPLVAQGEAAGVLRVVDAASIAEPHFQWGLLVARAAFVEQQPDLLRRLLRAYLRGVRHCQAHPEALRALLLKQAPAYDPAVLDLAFTRTLPVWNTDGAIDLAGLRRAVEVMVEISSLAAPLDADALVDLRGLGIG